MRDRHAGILDRSTAWYRLLKQRDQPVLAFLGFGLLITLLGLVFAILGSEVLEGETRAFDLHILKAAKSLRDASPALAESMRDVTALGSVAVLVAISLFVACYLLQLSNRRMALLVVAAALSGSLAVTLLKAGFGRLRPDPGLAHLVVSGAAFPSAHASMSAVVYLTIAALIASLRSSRAERVLILTTAALLSLLVGISRIILGVHWPTDVIAGWTFGTAWALLWVLLYETIAYRVRLAATANSSR